MSFKPGFSRLSVLQISAVALIAAALWIAANFKAKGKADFDFTVTPSRWEFAAFIDVPQCQEPSGIAIDADAGIVWLVDDGGANRPASLQKYKQITSVSQGGKEYPALEFISKLELGRDLEGVAINTSNGRIYVADEFRDKVYEVDGDKMTLLRAFVVKREFNGRMAIKNAGNGIEGIAFRPERGAPLGGRFYLANQDDPTCVLRVTIPKEGGEDPKVPLPIEIEWVFKGEQINLGDIMWNEAEGTLWLSHAWSNLLEIINPDNAIEEPRWETLPGAAQEGIALDGEGRLWIAQDVGGIAVYDKN
jgi:hypothetical protein